MAHQRHRSQGEQGKKPQHSIHAGGPLVGGRHDKQTQRTIGQHPHDHETKISIRVAAHTDNGKAQGDQAAASQSSDKAQCRKSLEVGHHCTQGIGDKHQQQRHQNHIAPVDPGGDEAHQDGRSGQAKHLSRGNIAGLGVGETQILHHALDKPRLDNEHLGSNDADKKGGV